jgi:hypothetical protein
MGRHATQGPASTAATSLAIGQANWVMAGHWHWENFKLMQVHLKFN